MISQITTRMPQIVAKIIAITLTLAGQGSNLKLDMLEAVDTIVTNGKIYRWDEYVTNMVKTICERCQEMGGIIKFPSLILWIVMYHIFPEGNLVPVGIKEGLVEELTRSSSGKNSKGLMISQITT